MIADRPQWDTEASMDKIMASAMQASEAEYEALPELQTKLRLVVSSISVYIKNLIRNTEYTCMDLYTHTQYRYASVCMCMFINIIIDEYTAEASSCKSSGSEEG